MKTLVIDAIVGIGFPSFVVGLECERVGLAKVVSSRYAGESFEWLRPRLEAVELDKLQELYTAMRQARDEIDALQPEPVEEPSRIILQ